MRFRHLIMVLALVCLYAPTSAEPDGYVGGETGVYHVTDLVSAEQQAGAYEQVQHGGGMTAKTEGES